MRKLYFSKPVLALSAKDQRLNMARQYLEDVRVAEGFESISWKDILMRRVRLIAVPGKTEARTREARCKRKAVKLLGLCISGELAQANFEHCLLERHGPKVLFSPAYAVNLIYRAHLDPEFRILELKDEIRQNRMRRISRIADRARELGILDPDPGLTVFTNARDDTLIRAYHKVHPNRTIVLRFHDRLHAGMGERSPSAACLVKMIHALREEGVVDEVESYYREDAEAIGGLYRPNAVNPEVLAACEVPYRTTLYRFIGGPKNLKNRDRGNVLKTVDEKLCELYSENVRSWIQQKIVMGPRDWEPYEEYLRQAAQAEVTVDLTRMGQDEGFSYRIAEALFWNKKIISNRLILREEPFYSPERVFLIGEDPLDRLQDFLEADLKPLPASILQLYDSSLWWTDRDPAARANQARNSASVAVHSIR